jgi:hypothetical protein
VTEPAETDMNERAIEELHRRWRAAEARGDEAAADAALAAMVRGLPLEAPSPGFAARVLARRAVSPAAAGAAAPARTPAFDEAAPTAAAARWAAAVLALLAAGTLGLASAVVTLLPKLDLGAGVRGFNGLVVMLWGWIADGVGLWLRAAEWSALVARVVAVPEVAWSLLAAALAAALSFYLLQRILANERKLIRAQRH